MNFRSRYTITEAIDSMPPGMAVEITQEDHSHVAARVAIPELARRFAADESVVGIAWLIKRPGSLRYVTRLKHEHYRPRHGGVWSTLFRVWVLGWLGETWEFVTVPREDRGILFELAARTRMRVADGPPCAAASADGLVLVIGLPRRDDAHDPRWTHRFPIGPDRVHTLENAVDWRRPRTPEQAERIRLAELAEVEAFQAARAEGRPFAWGTP